MSGDVSFINDYRYHNKFAVVLCGYSYFGIILQAEIQLGYGGSRRDNADSGRFAFTNHHLTSSPPHHIALQYP